MKTLEFTININASKEKVWQTLWEDKTFRDWSNLIDEGTYIAGELKEGNTIEFISGSSGYGVTSLVYQLTPYQSVTFRHMADTKDYGAALRDSEWTDGTESYLLTEKDGITTLSVKSEVPLEQEETMLDRFPKALARLKVLAEY